jgi:hypothetical protein
MKKKIPKASKKRLAVFGTISVMIILYFIFLLGYYIYQIYQLKEEQKKLNDNYTELKANEKELRNEIERLQDSDYIARYARENYSYSKNGEYILKLKSEDKKEENKKSFEINIDYNYIVYAGVAILIIIIIHIVRKRK